MATGDLAAWGKDVPVSSVHLSSLTFWTGPAYFTKDNLLFSECTDLNLSLVYKMPFTENK